MKKIKLFLASSGELKKDREEFEIFIGRKNKDLVDKDIFIEPLIWEDFLDVMSKSRLQDEYNKAIRGCDIFVMLFFTKVGKYTQEEFETAFGQFKSTNRPLILTYFKNAAVLTGDLKREEIMSLFAFQEKLKALGHYRTCYNNIHDLKLHFSSQLDKLLAVHFETRRPGFEGEIQNIHDLENFTLSVDKKILAALRDMQNLSGHSKSMIYEDILKGNLVGKNIELENFFKDFLPSITEKLSKKILEEVVIRVVTDSELKDLTYKTDSFEIKVEKPLLTWDCHCSVPNGVIPRRYRTNRSNEKSCPIHKDENGVNLTNVYRSKLRLISYDGIKVLFKTSPEFWPPTIDSFLMCKNMVSEGVLNQHYRSVLDLGSGTGFLGIYFGIMNQNINKIYLADWLLTPLVYSMMSWKLNQNALKEKKMKALLGLNSTWIPFQSPSTHFDLCICNPPYLPSLKEFPEIKINHTVGGTELLKHIISKGTEIAGETYVNFSDVAIHEAEKAAEKSGKILEPVGEANLVPFTVPQAFRYHNYINKLVEEKRLITKYNSRFKFWHRIKTYLIRDA